MSCDELRPEPARGTERFAALTRRTSSQAFGVAALVALALSGCSLGTAAPETSTRLLVTQEFGARPGVQIDTPKGRSGETALRLLEQNAEVRRDSRGGDVRSIDGQAVGRRPGRPDRWALYVNGVAPEQGAGATEVRAGDRLWWDRHETSAGRAAAVVGSFPEPFLHGYDGDRLPTRLECTEPRTPACTRVGTRLAEAGVVVGKGGLQTSLSRQTNRVIVGLWPAVRNDETVRSLEDGPGVSGVFAKPARDGRALAILDARGRVAQTLGPGSGLVAATRFEGGRPVWLVTGTDEAGLLAAADAVREGDLGSHFALAVSDGQAVDVPLVGPSPAADGG